MNDKSFVFKFFIGGREMVFEDLFRALRQYCGGHVLDVGEWDFYLTAKRKKQSPLPGQLKTALKQKSRPSTMKNLPLRRKTAVIRNLKTIVLIPCLISRCLNMS